MNSAHPFLQLFSISASGGSVLAALPAVPGDSHDCQCDAEGGQQQ
jgi:hypothetical protein